MRVRLASGEDPDKVLAPTMSGTVLGVLHDTVSWAWERLADKLGWLDEQILVAMLPRQEVRGLVGWIIHCFPLVPAGRFNIHRLFLVPLEDCLKGQLQCWLVVLNVATGLGSPPFGQ